MTIKYICIAILIVSSFSQLDSNKGIPDSLATTMRDTVQKLYVQFNNFGQQSSSLGLIHYYLSNIQDNIEHMNEHIKEFSVSHQLPIAEDDRLLIANKQLSSIKVDSTSIDLDFLISTSLRAKGIYGYLILGVYRVNLANIASIASDPDSVITKMNESQVVQAVKAIYLNTPDNLRILI